MYVYMQTHTHTSLYILYVICVHRNLYVYTQTFLSIRSDIRYEVVMQMPLLINGETHWIAFYVPVVLKDQK